MAKRKPEPGDVDFNWETMDPNTVDRLLAEAHGSLDSADQLATETDSARLAKLPASLAALREPYDTRGPVRKFTEPLANVGNKAMLAGIPAGAINPLIGGAMMSGGGLATIPDYLRKLIAPEGDESRPGMMESGGAALALLPAAGSLRSLRTVAQDAKPFIGPLSAAATMEPGAANLAGRALAYEGGAGVRPASLSSLQPIDRLMASSSFANLPRGNVSKATSWKDELLGAEGPSQPFNWPEAGGNFAADTTGSHVQASAQGANSFADAVRAEAARPFRRMSAEGAFAGDRTNRGIGALEAEGQQGLTAVQEGRVAPNEMPWEPVQLPPSLSPMERLAARSQERFGRKYRRE
jgi:hypothetical protein